MKNVEKKASERSMEMYPLFPPILKYIYICVYIKHCLDNYFGSQQPYF